MKVLLSLRYHWKKKTVLDLWFTIHMFMCCCEFWQFFYLWKFEGEFFFSACALCSLILHSNHFRWGKPQMVMESHILLDRPCLAPSLPGLCASPCPWYMSGTPEFYNSHGPSWIMLYRTKEMVGISFFLLPNHDRDKLVCSSPLRKSRKATEAMWILKSGRRCLYASSLTYLLCWL